MRYSVELLTKELYDLRKSLDKLIESYKRDSITLEVHNTHLSNLQPKIIVLKEDINKLNNYEDT